MAGFKGKYEYAIDDKGRLNLPAKLKKYVSPEANDTFTITRGHEGCLYLYPLDTWNGIERDFSARLNVHNEEDRLLLRIMLMHAQEVALDKQNRIGIPHDLLDIAKIKGNVILIGALDKIEIWCPEVLDAYLDSHADQTFEAIAGKVLGGNLR